MYNLVRQRWTRTVSQDNSSRGRIATSAAGLITEPVQAKHIIRTCQAAAVCQGWEMPRLPYGHYGQPANWAQREPWPNQYLHAER